jgi:FAD/FMN-containing dehydrogenase
MIWQVRRGDAAYQKAWQSSLFNELQPDRFPDLIVAPSSPQEVAATVRHARETGSKVAVRGRGHSWCGSPLRDGGLLLDLSRLHELRVDADAGVASVTPGITAAELSAAAGDHGLAFPVGHCGQVGLGGFLLSGGLGWNWGAWKPACFSVRACEVVTASGELIRVEEGEEPDLYWAARGAGPGFPGVVIRWELDLQPMPRAITSCELLYPVACFDEVVPWAVEAAADMPATVERSLMLCIGPPGTPLEGQPAVSVTATAFAATVHEATQSLAPFEPYPLPERAVLLQARESTPYDALFTALDSLLPERHRYAVDTAWTGEDAAAALDRLREPFSDTPSAKSFVVAVMPPAHQSLPDAAFSMIDRTFLACYAVWQDERDDRANRSWLRRITGALEPIVSGHYIAEADLTADRTRTTRSFAGSAWQRLRAIRPRYDPDGVFSDYLGLV